MKHGKIFGLVIYFIFTFLLGVILALTVPMFLMVDVVPEVIAKDIEDGQYSQAMLMVVCYYNSEPVYQREFDKGGIVLFEALAFGVDEEGHVAENKMRHAYTGFLYGVGETYQTSGTSDNCTKLVVTNLQGEEVSVELLDVDENGDMVFDRIDTLVKHGFVYIELDEDVVGSVDKLTFLDKTGEEFWSTDEVSLDFSGSFFVDCNDYLYEYNNRKQDMETLKNLHFEFLAKSDNYHAGSDAQARRIANIRAAIIIVVYFVVIYVIADFLFGTHFIIKFFRWFLYKVCKVKPKNKPKYKKEEIFGHDYYSMVTMSLDLEAVPDFNESVQVKYTNSDAEVVFILLKGNNYTATERIKAGTYVNPFIDINRDYAPVDLPDNLEVEGYKMDVKIKIIKREV